MVALLLRGAVVPFYLRLHPETGRNGAADTLVKKKAPKSDLKL
jgi:hypothetical protein